MPYIPGQFNLGIKSNFFSPAIAGVNYTGGNLTRPNTSSSYTSVTTKYNSTVSGSNTTCITQNIRGTNSYSPPTPITTGSKCDCSNCVGASLGLGIGNGTCLVSGAAILGTVSGINSAAVFAAETGLPGAPSNTTVVNGKVNKVILNTPTSQQILNANFQANDYFPVKPPVHVNTTGHTVYGVPSVQFCTLGDLLASVPVHANIAVFLADGDHTVNTTSIGLNSLKIYGDLSSPSLGVAMTHGGGQWNMAYELGYPSFYDYDLGGLPSSNQPWNIQPSGYDPNTKGYKILSVSAMKNPNFGALKPGTKIAFSNIPNGQPQNGTDSYYTIISASNNSLHITPDYVPANTSGTALGETLLLHPKVTIKTTTAITITAQNNFEWYGLVANTAQGFLHGSSNLSGNVSYGNVVYINSNTSNGPSPAKMIGTNTSTIPFTIKGTHSVLPGAVMNTLFMGVIGYPAQLEMDNSGVSLTAFSIYAGGSNPVIHRNMAKSSHLLSDFLVNSTGLHVTGGSQASVPGTRCFNNGTGHSCAVMSTLQATASLSVPAEISSPVYMNNALGFLCQNNAYHFFDNIITSNTSGGTTNQNDMQIDQKVYQLVTDLGSGEVVVQPNSSSNNSSVVYTAYNGVPVTGTNANYAATIGTGSISIAVATGAIPNVPNVPSASINALRQHGQGSLSSTFVIPNNASNTVFAGKTCVNC